MCCSCGVGHDLRHQPLLHLLSNSLKAKVGGGVEAGRRQAKERFSWARVFFINSGIGAAAAACWIARAAFGTETARWQRYRRAMLHSASDRVLRFCFAKSEATLARGAAILRSL